MNIANHEKQEQFDIYGDIMETKIDNVTSSGKYTWKIDPPTYTITGKCPSIDMLIDTTKAMSLINKIITSNLSDVQKQFLIYAAYRHIVFDFKNIAEYYAHSTKEMQELMEESALVIIDINDAIKNGYITLHSDILEQLKHEYE